MSGRLEVDACADQDIVTGEEELGDESTAYTEHTGTDRILRKSPDQHQTFDHIDKQ